MHWHQSSQRKPLARIEVDTGAAQRNLAAIVRATGRPALCVVKADAYGHGAVRIATAIENDAACSGFAVARMEEAAALRPALTSTKPILCFGTFLAARSEGERKDILGVSRELDVECVLASLDDVDALLALPRRMIHRVPFHLAVNSGMNREGLGVEDLAAAIERLRASETRIASIWTHFASSEQPDASTTVTQLEQFSQAVALCGGSTFPVHLENSAAALHALGDQLPAALCGRIQASRVGGALYGLDLRDPALEPRLEPVMRVVTRFVQVHSVAQGAAVGYDGSWVAARDSVIGLAAVGYADGLQSCVPDLIWCGSEQSRKVPVVGRVSMDLITVDCTEAARAGRGPVVGDELVVLGASRGLEVDARSHGTAAGIVDYAVTVAFSRRLPVWSARAPSDSSGGSV